MLRTLVATTIASLAFTASAGAAFIVNGDFETLDGTHDFAGWTEGAGVFDFASPSKTPIEGDHSVKLISSSGSTGFSQTFSTSEPPSNWTVSFDVATTNPGTNGTARSLELSIWHGTGRFTLRVVDTGNGIGDIQAFRSSDSSWQTVLSDAVTFSADDTSLKVNHFVLSGDYSDGSPTYSIAVTRPLTSGTELVSVDDVSVFRDGTPSAGDGITAISFANGNMHSNGFFVLDNVSVVPEPATFLLGSLAVPMLLHRRGSRS